MNIEIHPFDSRFIEGVLRLLAESMPFDPISKTRFTQQVLLDPNFRAEGALVALQNDQVVGFCLGLTRQVPLENAPDDSERGYISLLAVSANQRRRGIATRLLAGVEAYFRSQGCALVMISSYAPGYFIPGVDVEAYAAALAFWMHQGYAEVYRPLAMQTSLWKCTPPDWVEAKKARLEQEGVTLRAYASEMTLELLDFARREFPGDWVRLVRETMGQILQRESPQRLICAVENGRVLGFAHHDKERFGPIGVASAERGRGLGQVLMWETLRLQREEGLRASWFLWSDDRTATRLYNGAGFVEVRRFALLKKVLGAKEATP